MNWRTFTPWLLAWIILSWINNSRELTMQDSIIATVVGGIIVAVIVWIISFFWSALSDVSKRDLFSIRFVDHDPPGSTETPLGTFYEIPLGTSSHWVKVVTNEGLAIDEINLRFISCEEANKTPSNYPEDIRTIISIAEANITPEIIAQGTKAVQTQDRHGGIDIKLIPAYPLGTKRAMFIKIDIDAKQIWSGKISFRINDKDHHPRYARTDARITDLKVSPSEQRGKNGMGYRNGNTIKNNCKDP